ncbi:MAG: CoA ester lyase [Chloroflexota bacterium]|nr:CoA ester lyase [Chloroflexota bacterium]
MDGLRPMRSLMFVPAHRERMVKRALGLGEFGATELDVAILDLEDGVPPAAKDDALRLIADALGRSVHDAGGPSRFVRIRRALSDDGAADLETVVRPGLAGIMAPKVRGPDEVEWMAERLDALERDAKIALGTVRIIPSIESAAALLEAPRIAKASDRVVGLAFGSEDFALDLTVVAAVAAGKLAFDGIWPDIKDAAGLRADTLRARRLGFAGKTLIHPDQVVIVNEIFSPSATEVEEARRVVHAFDEALKRGEGAVALDGQMLDAPVVDRARRVLRTIERNS